MLSAFLSQIVVFTALLFLLPDQHFRAEQGMQIVQFEKKNWELEAFLKIIFVMLTWIRLEELNALVIFVVVYYL